MRTILYTFLSLATASAWGSAFDIHLVKNSDLVISQTGPIVAKNKDRWTTLKQNGQTVLRGPNGYEVSYRTENGKIVSLVEAGTGGENGFVTITQFQGDGILNQSHCKKNGNLGTCGTLDAEVCGKINRIVNNTGDKIIAQCLSCEKKVVQVSQALAKDPHFQKISEGGIQALQSYYPAELGLSTNSKMQPLPQLDAVISASSIKVPDSLWANLILMCDAIQKAPHIMAKTSSGAASNPIDH